MNFNFLFGIVGNLNFIITFLLNEKDQQDFFMFEGVDSAAHLQHYNHTVYLQLNNGTTAMLYKTVGSHVAFPMTFNAFTFLTPLVTFSSSNIPNEKRVWHFKMQ